ncbi:TPM domain-containing protein [Algirhabdus cladophorae]|uniref:TPM domain-containing protein n=1 Tax=Algirhabdus cladophorae TaxID=3377108 RepID=UPI003B84ADEB
MRLLLTICLWIGLSFGATAQTYPDYTSTTVNDFADLLPEDAEARVRSTLERLKSERDVEITLVTLTAMASYVGPLNLEDYATNLFNTWGVGDSSRNDGILVLIFRQDREMRIALGSGYGFEWDRAASEAIERGFIPSFRNNDYAGGIERGIQQTIDRIAIPFQNGEVPKTAIDWEKYGIFGLFVGIAAIVLGKGPYQKLRLKRRACPQCGQTGGLQQSKRTTTPATRTSTGAGYKTTTCLNCSYHDEQRYTISRTSSSSGGSFGGGSSSGGGASGKW